MKTGVPAPSAPTTSHPPAPHTPPVTPLPVVVPSSSDPTEAQLEKEVEALWQAHNRAKSSARKTTKNLKLIRDDLARALHALKNALSRPGCKGEWSSFLGNHTISRTTADRLVSAHEKSIGQPESNCTTGAIEEPTDVVVHRYLHGLWPKLSLVLTSREHVEVFIAALTNMAEKSFGADDEASSSSASNGAATSA